MSEGVGTFLQLFVYLYDFSTVWVQRRSAAVRFVRLIGRKKWKKFFLPSRREEKIGKFLREERKSARAFFESCKYESLRGEILVIFEEFCQKSFEKIAFEKALEAYTQNKLQKLLS